MFADGVKTPLQFLIQTTHNTPSVIFGKIPCTRASLDRGMSLCVARLNIVVSKWGIAFCLCELIEAGPTHPD